MSSPSVVRFSRQWPEAALHAVILLLDQAQSPRRVARHVDDLAHPGARLARGRDQHKVLPICDRQVGGPFGSWLQPAAQAIGSVLQKHLAVLARQSPSQSHELEVADLFLALRVAVGNTQPLELLTTPLARRADLGAETRRRKARRIEGVEPDGRLSGDLGVERKG